MRRHSRPATKASPRPPGDKDGSRDQRITQEILKHLGKMGHRCLLHNCDTITTSGGFSWAPEHLFACPYASIGDLEGGGIWDKFLTISTHGTVEGLWHYRPLTQENCDGGLKPYDDDPKVSAIDVGLRRWRDCVLLRERTDEAGDAVLVATVGKEPGSGMQKGILDCRYLGPVREKPDPSPPGGLYDGRFRFGLVRLGNDGGRELTDARRLLGLLPP